MEDIKDEEKGDNEKKDEDEETENEIDDETENETETENDNETKEDDDDMEDDEDEDEEQVKDFSAKESFSHPKSRKYFGKDQIFTGLDRRRSKYEDILLLDPVLNVTQQTNNTNAGTSTRTKIGTKRRNS